MTNASIWVVEVPFDCVKPPSGACLGGAINDGCTVFGFREQDVVDGETPALAGGRFQFDYIADTHAALRNLFSESLLSFKMQINADGPLMFEECGEDTGRLGRLMWGKPGLFAIPPAQDPTKVHGAGLLFPNDDLHLFEIRRGR